jgi:putative ATP-dependent endonuclease of the OLD family
MRVLAIHVQHFRCIENESLQFDDLTALVGANGAGKSSFLRALNYFYEGPGGITREDFYNRDTTQPIQITVSYGALGDEEREAFSGYVHDDVLKVVLRVTWLTPDDGGEGSARPSYHGWIGHHKLFQDVRGAATAPDRLAALRSLVEGKPELYDFTPESAWTRAGPQMAEWESAHPEQCTLELDDGSYFKAPNTETSPLAPYTQFIFVPAVREASDEAAESRTSTIGRLVALVVGDISTSKDVQRVSQESKQAYVEVVRKEESERLPALQQQLTEALRGYAPHASVKLTWQGADVRLTSPRTVVWLEEDRFEGEIEGKGHGLQRLFIVSILQVAAATRAAFKQEGGMGTTVQEPAEESDIEPGPRLRYVLAIEEPELYQHPMQARRFARVLYALASAGAGDANTQVVYSTHSPLFVGVDRFDGIRLARKLEAGTELPLVTRVHSTTLDQVMTVVNQAFGRARYSLDRFRSTLKCIFSPSVSEGFFAHTVVLVEGPEDGAVVEAALRAADVDLEGEGIAVVPVEGKANLDRPYAIFTALGISCYLVFDGDSRKRPNERRPEINRALQSLCGEEQPVEFPETGARERYAAFRRELTRDLPEEFGAEQFYSARDQAARDMGWEGEPSRAQKNPVVLEQVIRRMHEAGRRSPTLDNMVDAIRALAAAARAAP